MSDVIKGVVEKKLESMTSAGVTYALVIDNVRYGFYKTNPKCNEGDTVTFAAKTNGNFWNADPKTFRVVAAEAAPTDGATTRTATPKWVPDKDRQEAISYQSARKDALEIVGMMLGASVLDMGKSKTVADKMEVIEAYVDKYTSRFFQDTKDLGHVGKEASKPEVKAAAPDDFNDEIPF